MPVYGASLTKRRSTKAELIALLCEVHKILAEATTQITVRHLFYRLVSSKFLEKTEAEYKRLCAHLSNWRKQGSIEWSAFVDSTRWHLRQDTFDGLKDAAERTIETYRRNLWSEQPYYVEVWVEKDAIAGLIYDRARLFGVPVFVCRGYASLSSMYSAAVVFQRAERAGKLPVIFHLGDYDPSGHGAADSAENSLHEHFGCNLLFERIAVTEDQIGELNLPTRPVKLTDSRAKNWKGSACVELDAMDPKYMQNLVEQSITGLIDEEEWETLKTIEAEERQTLSSTLASMLNGLK